ncbi:hypothetical protein ASPACDRAFT_1879411 [Aspergillus aculeatus ATCC 16872]|uniref:Succinyl-diaminopimelate desuccinylase n=1 Tax=Aspergillus aculeatus (strain ATCC 16872 / CBS 172.66 / WB 5094) TaxID=690307 RepID=A0A1L9X033_ASPA1|nr:uncharacterized protein ASPACDRAFT_1879411 [Aspergillus aculeatus ATCC 16872]OJK01872.1 hypothetical protein ASPACDRAFT_1879411 [Aspergillus aculeatus ATCC 16872]
MAPQRRSIYINSAPSTIVSPPVAQVRAFHEQFPGYQASPLVPLPEVAQELGVRAVYVKQENNRYGLPSFKVLGASWAIYRALLALLDLPLETSLDTLTERIREGEPFTLMAATEGNHGRAVAWVARQLSLQARIYVPRTMVAYTQEMIRSEGADVIVADGDYDYAVLEAAKASQATKNAILVQDTAFEGYEEIPAWIVEGYSTLMHEVDVQLQALGQQNTLVVSPAGVGSLAQAVAIYSKSRTSPATFVAVEPDTAACLNLSLKTGQSTSIVTSPSIMAGMNCGTVSSAAWPVLQKLVDASVTISDYESHCAVQYLASNGVDSGPCGAASLAAIWRLKAEHDSPTYFSPDSVIVLLSTEGRRPYQVPEDVSSDDPIVLTQTLTRIDSSNPTLSKAKGAGETDIVNYLSAWFAHRGIEHHRVETKPGRPSVVGVVRGTGGGKSLMFNGHVDTVTLSTYEGNGLSGHLGEKDGRQAIFGRGTLDMKAGVAAGLSALASAQRSRLAGDVIVTAVADEEDASQGTMDVIEAGWKADGAVVLEPTNLRLAHAHKGFVWVELEVQGCAAHGSNPAAGVDAIMNMGLLLQALKQYQQQLPVNEVLGQASLHCGVINGGDEVSSYPASCSLTVEFRTVPAQTEEIILDELRGLLTRIHRQNVEFQFSEPRITFSRPCQYLPESHPLVQQMVKISNKVLEEPVPVVSVPFWCDAALLTQAGIPSIVLGPAGEGLHAKEEWVEVNSSLLDETNHFIDQSPGSGASSWNIAPSLETSNGFLEWEPLSDNAASFALPIDYSSFDYPVQQTELPDVLSTDNLSQHDTFASFDYSLAADPSLPAHSNRLDEDFVSVSQWLDGAYRPPVPCSYCQRHRLQCLILRTTSANPNPVTSCSSCVALYRECSLAQGEKRQAAGFETISPVFGHLHGLAEEHDGGIAPSEPGFEASARQTDHALQAETQARPRFSRKGAKILRDWFNRNQHSPYPTDEQRAEFASQTGFTERQISNWFANARRRRKMAFRTPRPNPATPSPRGSSPMPTSRYTSLTPMERWQKSPPDQDPVPPAVIQKAIATSSLPPAAEGGLSRSERVEASHRGDGHAYSVSSVESGQFESARSQASSDTASSAAWSYNSDDHFPFPLSDSRRRRHYFRRRPSSTHSLGDLQYQCTFCSRSFKKKHDWCRHESSMHLCLESWFCTVDTTPPDNLEPVECEFCETPRPSPAHLESHEFDVCADRPPSERTFARKDHLIQHLRKFHRCTKVPAARVQGCRSTRTAVTSRCGFCDAEMQSWTERADHLADHFKKGLRMDQWTGGWGLDRTSLAMLRDATLPAQRSSGS